MPIFTPQTNMFCSTLNQSLPKVSSRGECALVNKLAVPFVKKLGLYLFLRF